MAQFQKETVLSIAQAAEMLDELVDRVAGGETILIADENGDKVQLVAIDPAEAQSYSAS